MKRALALALCGLVSSNAMGAIVLSESFDYANHAAFLGTWNASANDNDFYLIDTGVGNPAGSYALNAPTANFTGRAAINLGGTYNGTNAQPLEFSVDMLLEDTEANVTASWGGARHYIEMRGYTGGSYLSGSLANLVAIGVNNVSDDGSFSTLKYQGRAIGTPDTGGADWQTLTGAANRSTGWHTLKLVIDSDSYDFYLDGVLGKSVTRTDTIGFDSIALGSDLTANGRKAWIDNIKVEITPEPATLALLGLGGLALARRRR